MEDQGNLGYIPIKSLNDIIFTRQGYDRNRDWIILFEDETFRRELIDFYLRLGSACQDATSLEALAIDPAQAARYGQHIANRRPELVALFRDIAGRGRGIIQKIDLQ